MTDSEWRIKYEARINSVEWRNMRSDIMRMRGKKCERCGSTFALALHHKTYERLGCELLSDLELVCKRCHKKADKDRAVQGRIRSAQARYNAGLNTYATKKYGEDWEYYGDPDRIEQEFDEWCERQDE